MEQLRIETQAGLIPLDADMIRKYGLRPGLRAPFTGGRIVGESGRFPAGSKGKPVEEDAFKQHSQEEIGVKAEDGIMLTASERIDFALGADSDEEPVSTD